MDGVPDLSALLKGKLQLLSKKSTTADVQGATNSDAGRASEEGAPGLVDKDVGVEPPASSPKKKKKSKKARRKATEELPLEEIASLAKPPRVPAIGREGTTRGSVESDRSEVAPEDRPRKKKKKKSVEAEPRPSDAEMGLVEVVAGGDISLETPPEEREVSARGSDPVTGERSIPDPSARKGSRSEGSSARRKKIEFPDRVEFSYDETTPLILNPLRCAELTRQIRGGSLESDRSETAPEDRPRKKKKKKSIEAEPRPSDVETGLVEVVAGGGVPLETPPEEREVSARGSDPAASERSIPDPSARKGSRSEGSTVRRRKIEFPDRVKFSYNETTPLILNPLRCAELTRQIRGGTKEMPQLDDLYFKTEYIDDASSRARSDGSMNFLVEKYVTTLKQTMIQLGSSEKLAQTRLKVIERVRSEHKKANEKAAKEKEILRVKFEELEGKLKSSSAARKELVREKIHLEQTAANLEKEKTELVEERDAAVDKLIR
ncbi:hypothetical protein F2Q69_00046079 [Brassica cretica]|uniref:Uncharacterized protein n=1 Tax=Brassica cretica TaxID=69181 RepID=A0A8S9PRZ9_BRACR|nr:hypothetical protein F2Q69_00046079 [Brassica cretica]